MSVLSSIKEISKNAILSNKLVPGSFYIHARDLPYAVADMFVKNPDSDRLPPLRLQCDGPRGYDAFLQNGNQAFAFYKDVLGIRPDSKILEIGSGLGRKAIPMIDYIGKEGLFVGMDIVERSVNWCSRHISTRNPRFVFIKQDVHNMLYNPHGRIRPTDVVLPFPDQSFDHVLLWSVFTHMYPKDIAHYLSEIARVVKPSGKTAISYLLMTEHAKAEVAAGRASLDLVHELKDERCWTNNLLVPEDVIGVDEQWLRDTSKANGLDIVDIRQGSWSNNPVPAKYDILNVQDIVISQRVKS